MAEIQESSRPCLPEGLENRDIFKLEGTFNLQINTVLNVGESAYSQIQKLKGQDDPQELNFKANPSEPKIKPSRMLLLEMTDGTQNLFGMEYQQIPSLTFNTPPGSKIQVSGPVTCRLGALLLTPSNVKVLGGSIMHLIEDNSYWNMLHHAIGQDPPRKPDITKTEAISIEMHSVDQMTVQDNSTADITSPRDSRTVVKRETNQKNFRAGGLTSNNTRGRNKYKGKSKPQVPNEPKEVQGCKRDLTEFGASNKLENVCDEEFFDDDNDLLAAVADDDFFGIEEDFDMEQIDRLEKDMQTSASTKANTSVQIKSNMISSEIPCYDEIFDDDFVDEDILANDSDSMEIKPLHGRFSNAQNIRHMQVAKQASRASNSPSTKFSDPVKKSSNYNSVSAFSRKLDGSSWRPSNEQSNSTDNIKRGFMCKMNNPTHGCVTFVKCEPGDKSKDSETKRNPPNTNSDHFGTKKLAFTKSSSILIKKESDNEFGSMFINNNATAVEFGRSQCLDAFTQEGSPAPFKYLSDVLMHAPVSGEQTVRIKAYIATLLSPPDPTSSQWNIIVKLNDGTATVDALLSEKILTELLECPIDEYRLEIQEAMKSRNPALCQRLHKRTQQFERNLASASGLMDLQFSPDTPLPLVLSLTRPTFRDVSKMIHCVRATF
ncbi:RecQ-mediated genome instability protein 1 [Stylophora pistillata]|uniref:RecQ-mediated genome instability protein 1 n=2 Tax=Stylophora pistillata TaxID=50429 RepID=A0A2B4SYS6_STYPI|nr:RecQ-mediated genome instability protein 1 [Stylophora pistillata]